jgi:hypothetical protein
MYHSKVVEKRLNNLADVLRRDLDPKFEFHDTSIDKIDHYSRQLEAAFEPEKETLLRPLALDEEVFIRHELNRCKVDFRYFANHYIRIKTKAQELIRLKFTYVQELLLEKIANAELAAIQGKSGDGILLSVLKARQLGISTISEAILSHRAFFYGNTTALIAADIDERSAFLFDMTERIYENLPWWMRPHRTYHIKDKQMYFGEQDSLIKVVSSKNLQGGDSGGDRGSLGTGQTIPLAHLSELALWENAYQIDDALMPSIPQHPRTFAVFESTAKGRGNWWHEAWLASMKGLSRRRPVFIPWYTDPDTYKKPAPLGWSPDQTSLAHAKRVSETSAHWIGKTITLSRDQLYWWEWTRADYLERKVLHKFLAEYASDPLEAFQNTTIGVFPSDLLDHMRQTASNRPIIVDIKPKSVLRKEESEAKNGKMA